MLEEVQHPARLIGGESGAGLGFEDPDARLRVVLAFPDTYEIGISNQALQILYHVAATTPGVGVERAYLPWVDVLAALRREAVPLLTLESWSPVAEAHLLGVSLQHELSYTNLLELLDVAGLPPRGADRGEGHPLVVVGGPATADFLPVAPFVDAVVVGEAEELFSELLITLRDAVDEGVGRTERKRRLAGLDGVFVPGMSDGVRRRVLRRLEGAPYPEQCLVPLTAGVHDRAWVEIMRGCSRGCRFCQAGMWYRPVRERSAASVLASVEGQAAATGYAEVSLASLSTTDYTGLGEVLGRVGAEHPELRVGLPSLRVDSASVRLGHLVSPTSPSLTLAPEAGSQRLRDVINKNVGDEDILAAAREAFSLGHTTLKLYFMMGLPTETDDDVAAIADLCRRLTLAGREALGPQAGRLQLHVSVTNFIPKAFTPFQWAPMADRRTLTARQELLRRALRRLPVRLSLHDIDASYLEAALARGGGELADVIEDAWRRGARFDNWTEHHRPRAWREAFAAAGLDIESLATSPLSRESSLPWEVIDGVVGREFLRAEWDRATRGETTPDCRWDACAACGACDGDLAIDLAGGGAEDPAPAADGDAEAQQAATPRAAGRPAGGTVSTSSLVTPGHRSSAQALRYLVSFRVTGPARFVAHLDTLELLRRAVRRAGGTLALSAGMRPKPLLGLALPRPVGVEGEAELGEFTLAEPPPADFGQRLAEALPRGLTVLELRPLPGRRSLAARVAAVSYRVEVTWSPVAASTEGRTGAGRPGQAVVLGAVSGAAERYATLAQLEVEREREGKRRVIDVRRYVDEVTVEEAADGTLALGFTALVTPRGTVRPYEVVQALARLSGVALRVRRAQRCAIILDPDAVEAA